MRNEYTISSLDFSSCESVWGRRAFLVLEVPFLLLELLSPPFPVSSVALMPTSMNASSSWHFLRCNWRYLKSPSAYSLRLRSASPSRAFDLPVRMESLDYSYIGMRPYHFFLGRHSVLVHFDNGLYLELFVYHCLAHVLVQQSLLRLRLLLPYNTHLPVK